MTPLTISYSGTKRRHLDSSSTELRTWRLFGNIWVKLSGNSFYEKEPLSKFDKAHVPAREFSREFFVEQMVHIDKLLKYPAEQILFTNDEKTRTNIVDSELTSAYNILLAKGCKSVFAKPLDLLNLEFLALTVPLERLWQIYLQTMKELSEEMARENGEVKLDRNQLKRQLVQSAMERFPKELYRQDYKSLHVLHGRDSRYELQQREKRRGSYTRVSCSRTRPAGVSSQEKRLSVSANLSMFSARFSSRNHNSQPNVWPLKSSCERSTNCAKLSKGTSARILLTSFSCHRTTSCAKIFTYSSSLSMQTSFLKNTLCCHFWCLTSR